MGGVSGSQSYVRVGEEAAQKQHAPDRAGCERTRGAASSGRASNCEHESNLLSNWAYSARARSLRNRSRVADAASGERVYDETVDPESVVDVASVLSERAGGGSTRQASSPASRVDKDRNAEDQVVEDPTWLSGFTPWQRRCLAE